MRKLKLKMSSIPTDAQPLPIHAIVQRAGTQGSRHGRVERLSDFMANIRAKETLCVLVHAPPHVTSA